MLFHRISICLSVAALMTCAGCGRHKADLAKSDPFLNSTPPAASVAEKSEKPRTGVLQAGKSAKDDADTKTAKSHETFNRAAANRFEEDGVPSRPGSQDLTASKSPFSTPGSATRSSSSTPKLPGTKPLAQTAFNPNESPDFDDDNEPEMKPLYERKRPTDSAKSNVELVASSAPAGDEAAPFPDTGAARRSAKPAATTKKESTVASTANPFEDDDTETAAAPTKHPLEKPAAESVATSDEQSGDDDHEFGAKPKPASATSSKRTATASRDADPFADDPFSESAFKSTAAVAADSKGDAAEEWAQSPAESTIAHKPVADTKAKSLPTAVDYDDEDQFAALRQTGHQKAATPRPAARSGPVAATTAKSDPDANPFADAEPAAAPKSKSSEARAAEWFDSAKETPKPTRTASIDRQTPPADPFADEADAPKAPARPQPRTAAKPVAIQPGDADEGPKPYVRGAKSEPAPQVEEEMTAPAAEPEGRVRLDDAVSQMSYEFEARPPKKQPATAPAKPSGWKARSSEPATEATPATKK